MFIEKVVCSRNKLLIPTCLSRLVSANQQNCAALWIKSKKHSVWPSGMLNNKFLHIGMAGRDNRSYIRTAQTRSFLFQDPDNRGNILLFCCQKPLPPTLKFVG